MKLYLLQLEVMRALHTHERDEDVHETDEFLVKNYRPVQPLGEREIKEGL